MSPPDSAAALESDTIGSTPEEFSEGEENSSASVKTTTAVTPDDEASGGKLQVDATTTIEQATGQPGLPDQDNDITAEAPIPADTEPRPEFDVTALLPEGIEGFSTPAERRDVVDKLLEARRTGRSSGASWRPGKRDR